MALNIKKLGYTLLSILAITTLSSCNSSQKQNSTDLFSFPEGQTTRWISFENPTGEKGKGGLMNDGAKGAAMHALQPGETITIADIEGSGIINRIWMTGGFVHQPADRRSILINMYWDGDKKPAVSAPINDFFGMSLPLKRAFESELFSLAEGRSYNSYIPMPFKKHARIEVTNSSDKMHMFYFDINYTLVKELPANSLYFHAYWHRNVHTTLKKDFEVLPHIEGKGRYLGSTLGVICDSIYSPSWFGEGEVKVFFDGDKKDPTLCGTGTEDYIGSGWSQYPFTGRYQGSPVAMPDAGLYSFYRYHIKDPIYFNKDCRVTIQQMGNAHTDDIRKIAARGAEMELVSVWDDKKLHLFNEPHDCVTDITDPDFVKGWVCFWRRDDVCSTAYFYLDRTSTNLPKMQDAEIRLHAINRMK